MLSSQTVLLKTSRGLLTLMHLSALSDPVQLRKSFRNTFSLTKRPLISWVLLSFTAFPFLLGCWEPSLPCIARGVCKQPQFPPTALGSFSGGCDYWSLLCLPPWLHQFAPESFKPKPAFSSMGQQPAVISPCCPPLLWLAGEELSPVLLSAVLAAVTAIPSGPGWPQLFPASSGEGTTISRNFNNPKQIEGHIWMKMIRL